MEPPCEHGGVRALYVVALGDELVLQWSRRVNTAECRCIMAQSIPTAESRLQWSRRVNTAECHVRRLGCTPKPCFNGAAV